MNKSHIIIGQINEAESNAEVVRAVHLNNRRGAYDIRIARIILLTASAFCLKWNELRLRQDPGRSSSEEIRGSSWLASK